MIDTSYTLLASLKRPCVSPALYRDKGGAACTECGAPIVRTAPNERTCKPESGRTCRLKRKLRLIALKKLVDLRKRLAKRGLL